MARSDRARVLVVDDDPDIQDLIKLALRRVECVVETASNGVEGLQRVSRALPDLVLLDMKMPVMDGLTFARELRARYGAVPVIVMTASADSRERAKAVDAVDAVDKPFELARLVEVVRHHLKNGKSPS